MRSYLRGLPVSARRGTFTYRSVKFIHRNKLMLAATLVFVLVGMIGVAVIVREARVARMQQARAERRFNDLRSLANSLLFEIHDSIVDLPGSTAARKLLVDRALVYFDSLSQESSGAPGLQRELATAYERVGDVQGNPYFANLGDTAAAIESYRKALKIRLSLADVNRGFFEDRSALVSAYMRLGLGLEAASDFAASLKALKEAYSIAETLTEERPNDSATQESLAGVCFHLASTQADLGDLKSSLDYYRRSAAIREKITSGSPEFLKQVQTRLAGVYGYTAGDLALQGDMDGAVALQHKAREILARLAASDPKNARLRQFQLESEYWSGFYLAQGGLQSKAPAVLSHRACRLSETDQGPMRTTFWRCATSASAIWAMGRLWPRPASRSRESRLRVRPCRFSIPWLPRTRRTTSSNRSILRMPVRRWRMLTSILPWLPGSPEPRRRNIGVRRDPGISRVSIRGCS